MKPLIVIFAIGMSLFGCLILATCGYHTWKFGGGDMEIGNFNRYAYFTQVDPMTKAVDRSWADMPTGERIPFHAVNMWVVGAIFLVGGPALLSLNHVLRDNRHF